MLTRSGVTAVLASALAVLGNGVDLVGNKAVRLAVTAFAASAAGASPKQKILPAGEYP
jgi:hypothetical protein